ncbi:MAG: Lrp/AsnC family transcriptional regulator [Alphaproteobacteria bacterium]|nr:Lrp/AsnC family transcriptional regulator [Alphaproteobacteria bacterium]
MPLRLDAIDRRILKELMHDGRITNVALAQRAGITPPPCLRRVRALEDAGYITGYHATVDERMVGFPVTVMVSVALHNQSDGDLRAFENACLTWPLVRECYMMSGDTDYHLKCVAPDLSAFERFLRDELAATPNVASVKTAVTIRQSKREPGVPLEIVP